MFKVRCPSSLLWHPALHHSLLLLRGLRQPHTLVILDSHGSGAAASPHLRFPTLADSAASVSVEIADTADAAAIPSLRRVHSPEHILWMCSTALSAASPETPPFPGTQIQRDLPAYLETSLVSAHLLARTDALLVALNTVDMEVVRQLHAELMDAVAQLDDTLKDDAVASSSTTSSSSAAAAAAGEPLSTWPLYTALQFLIEQGGLLTSAYPRVLAAYNRLSSDAAVRHHTSLVQRTIDAHAAAAAAYPGRGFLVEVQHRLSEYTTSAADRMTEGVTGDQGPLRSRVSGGRVGLQTVPARMPWTAKEVPLQRRR